MQPPTTVASVTICPRPSGRAPTRPLDIFCFLFGRTPAAPINQTFRSPVRIKPVLHLVQPCSTLFNLVKLKKCSLMRAQQFTLASFPPPSPLRTPHLHGTAGTVWDGCGTAAKVRIARVHRAWDGGTAVHPQSTPPPHAARCCSPKPQPTTLRYPAANSPTRSHRTTLRRRYPALSGTNRRY